MGGSSRTTLPSADAAARTASCSAIDDADSPPPPLPPLPPQMGSRAPCTASGSSRTTGSDASSTFSSSTIIEAHAAAVSAAEAAA